MGAVRRTCAAIAVAVTVACALAVPRARADCAPPRGAFLTAVADLKQTCAHALCGVVFDARATSSAASSSHAPPSCDPAGPALRAAMTGTLSAGGLAILGETHDNAFHHRLQAAAIDELSRTGTRPPAVVFEQFRADQQAGLDQFRDFDRRAARSGNIGDLKKMTDWEKSGWAKYDYDPLLRSVIAARLPLYAGDVTRDRMRAAAKEREKGLQPGEAKRLALDVALGPAADAASAEEIEAAHCGAIPRSATGGMAFAQRYRDATLADTALRAIASEGSAILIAGTGHARLDRAVPWYIRKRAPETSVISVMFVEVEEGKTDAAAYLPRSPGGEAAADFLVFTPPAEREDPCAKLQAK